MDPMGGFDTGMFAILSQMMGYIFIIMIIMIASMWKIFTKAGKPGWIAIIPIYSTIVWLDIVKKPWWWLLLMFIPYVGMVWAIWMLNLTSKAFGKGVGFTLGLLFLPMIFFPILAFDSSEYQLEENNYDY